MTNPEGRFVSALEVKQLHDAERAAWARRDDAELEARVMKRRREDGHATDETVTAADEVATEAGREWHKAYQAMQDGLRIALDTAGFDVPSVIRIARSMS